ncbi:hypothetical protein [Ilumatobacter sp.]|uniref:hypothetical protein n=1 Tax=Ilumatobacter sp. TaxID=1967498 RepID=UPI0037536B7C
MTRPGPTQVERFAAAAFYAPIGLGAQLVGDLPVTVGKAKQQIALARFIGKMAVDQGAKQLRERLSPAAVPPVLSPEPRKIVEVVPAANAVPAEPASVGVEALALPDYDQLPAAHIVGKLQGLTQAERDFIELYETAGRHRRTVLGKLDQLRKA